MQDNENRKPSATSGGLSITGSLLLIFIVLKLTGLIHWSWIWVLSPLWIGFAISIVITVALLGFCLAVMIIGDIIDHI